MNPHHPASPLRRIVLLSAAAALAFALGASPALSLDSGWAETEGGRMRLLVDPSPREDGSFTGILDIALEPGWKTYWRDPGSSGIPPMLDFSRSQGITLETMQYPPPVRVDDGYAIWAGYTAPVRFPLTFSREGSGDARIHASVFIGICEKICVPFQAEFDIDLPRGAVAGDGAEDAIRQAFDSLPQAESSDFRVEKAVYAGDGAELEISASLPGFRPAGIAPELFVAGPDGFAFAPPKLTSDDGGSARWTVRVEHMPDAAGKTGSEIIDVVITLGQRAMAQSVAVHGFSGE
tara:strand:+ start:65 stop:940 length:876 start_codon:yes stop_codon:yes gene_type:complete